MKNAKQRLKYQVRIWDADIIRKGDLHSFDLDRSCSSHELSMNLKKTWKKYQTTETTIIHIQITQQLDVTISWPHEGTISALQINTIQLFYTIEQLTHPEARREPAGLHAQANTYKQTNARETGNCKRVHEICYRENHLSTSRPY